MLLVVISLLFGLGARAIIIINKQINLSICLYCFTYFDLDMSILVSPVCLLFSSLVCFISFVVYLFILAYFDSRSKLVYFNYFTGIFIICILVLINFNDFFFVMLGWDGLGVTSYFLIAYFQSPNRIYSSRFTILINRLGDWLIIIFVSASRIYLSLSPNIVWAVYLLYLVVCYITWKYFYLYLFTISCNITVLLATYIIQLCSNDHTEPAVLFTSVVVIICCTLMADCNGASWVLIKQFYRAWLLFLLISVLLFSFFVVCELASMARGYLLMWSGSGSGDLFYINPSTINPLDSPTTPTTLIGGAPGASPSVELRFHISDKTGVGTGSKAAATITLSNNNLTVAARGDIVDYYPLGHEYINLKVVVQKHIAFLAEKWDEMAARCGPHQHIHHIQRVAHSPWIHERFAYQGSQIINHLTIINDSEFNHHYLLNMAYRGDTDFILTITLKVTGCLVPLDHLPVTSGTIDGAITRLDALIPMMGEREAVDYVIKEHIWHQGHPRTLPRSEAIHEGLSFAGNRSIWDDGSLVKR